MRPNAVIVISIPAPQQGYMTKRSCGLAPTGLRSAVDAFITRGEARKVAIDANLSGREEEAAATVPLD